MKKTIFLLLTSFIALMANAQQTWDFSTTPASDVELLKAATSEWTYTEASNRYSNKNAIDGAVKAGNTELQMTKGLLVNGAAAEKFKIDVNKRIQLGGKNISIIVTDLKKGQEVTVSFASTGDNAVTFDKLENLTDATGFVAADKNTTQEGKAKVLADGNVSLASTGGSVNVFSIRVSESEEPGGGGGEPSGSDHSVAKNNSVNQACLSLVSGAKKYYNTTDISAIDIVDETITVCTAAQEQDVYQGVVSGISFSKKTDDGSSGVIENHGVVLTEANGWLESFYVKWNLLENATSYNVYVKGGQYADFKKIDSQLVRKYATYGRADVVGLIAASDYQVKVVPVINDAEDETQASIASAIPVKSYDRSGYAHFNYNSGVGAYNNDGTLKQNAVVIYVTANNAKTVTAKLSSGEFTGLQAIVTAFEKGNVTTPLAIRFIGTIKASDVDSFGSSEEGIQVKGKRADSELNITFEGIGEDATIYGFGFLCRNSKSVEFRNFGIMRCMDDGISLDTDNSNIWMHNIDVYYGKHGSGDHAKGDGAIDVKSDSKFVTLSYCRFWDTGKSNMFGMKSESGPNYITYHHNWFDHSDSRHPRIRTMSVHVYNNYYDGNSKYGVGVTTGASCFAENNYFRHTHDPLLSSKQGTDAKGTGTFSGEDGGIIKAFGNIYAETGGSSYYVPITYQTNSSSFDCYEASTRDEQVPETVKTLSGGTSYNNFDTNPDLIYGYTPDAAADVPAIVTGYYGAGRLNHGDCQFTFNNAVDDTSYDVNSALENLIDTYKSSLIGIFGDENSQSGEGGEGGGGGETPEPTPEGTILVSFDDSPSNSMFAVGGSYGDGKITYEGTYYKRGVKLDSKGSITFTPSQNYNMTLVLATAKSGRNVKLNNVLTTVSGTENTEGAYYELQPISITKDTQYVITKGSAESLVMLIKLEPVE